ncbi:MAG: hypothetical protein M3256_05820 [Actinomycetota bacterium]|nr:hypothetical protein [Actinomycetota bacterium]
MFGISRDVPLTYIPRPTVDGLLIDNLTRDKHIVIFGSSKQGKTCLRKYNLKDEEYIVVTCSNTWSLAQLHSAILKAAGYVIEQTTTRTIGGGTKISAKLSGRLRLGIAEIGGDIGSDDAADDKTEVTEKTLELDPADVNDIIAALEEVDFSGFIVLEDFHYLPDEAQLDFAVALKAFHEASNYSFIVVGVWLDQNRLIQFNGDLTGRVVAVNADAWAATELEAVMAAGESLLNITFDERFKAELVGGCFDSVSVVQETCHRACELAGVFSTSERTTGVGGDISASELIREVVDQQSARYNTFVANFSEGFQVSELEMYKWLLAPVLLADSDTLEGGIAYNSIRTTIDQYHPRGPINPGNITQALQSTASLQARFNIKPIILDYDQTKRRLNVVDRGFLVWLKYQDFADLVSSAGLPATLGASQP